MAAQTLPPFLQVEFPSKTLTGYGAVVLPNPGAATILSQVDGAGAVITSFQYSQNALSWKGTSATYGQPPPTGIAATCTPHCTVIIQKTGDATIQTVVWVTVSSTDYAVREMAGTPFGRWTTDSMYTIDGTGSSGTFQARTVLTATGLACADTLWFRKGLIDPTSSGLRLKPKAITCTAGNEITLRSFDVDTSLDANGVPNKKHGFRWGGGLRWDSGTAGDTWLPYIVRDMWAEPQTSGSGFTYAANGYCISYINNRVSLGAGHGSPTTSTAMQMRGAASGCTPVADSNLIIGTDHGFTTDQSPAGGRSVGIQIINNDGYSLLEDAMTDGQESTLLQNNFFRDWRIGDGTEHSDCFQFLNNTVATWPGPLVIGNFCGLNTGVAQNFPEGQILNSNPGGRVLSAPLFKWNIVMTKHTNGEYYSGMNDISSSCNSMIFQLTSAIPRGTHTRVVMSVSGEPGVNINATHNLANFISYGAQTGTKVITPNSTITIDPDSPDLTQYTLHGLPFYHETGIYTRAQIKAAFTPDSQLQNGDSTWNGALDGSGNPNPFCN